MLVDNPEMQTSPNLIQKNKKWKLSHACKLIYLLNINELSDLNL